VTPTPPLFTHSQAKKKAQEDLEAQILADALQKRREEKEARKKVRMEARLVRYSVY
jgi:hypothetical protein